MTHRTASMTLDFPHPFGPTTPMMRAGTETVVYKGFESRKLDMFKIHQTWKFRTKSL